ncbi:aldehyde dehydrogenase [Rhodobacter xanthinilyticus]|uniref:Aldehyde dehydrogenase n=1 Tax=Rhodobacter xanthinilyticus TaxID=1850250 RepID=A0A1D9MC59_9RHOB|nr:cytochrome c [Rhodobacter xanthinilyticus]AOZ69388.1 aldehyde dehydrogenase [Rhodobacter xanthinilyticus]
MLRSTLSALAIAGVLAAGGFGLYAYHGALPAITAAERPQFAPEVIEQGRILASAGYCATCHTAAGGAPFAGNYPIVTAFGTIYASNITPDPKTGIGSWSPEAFRRAMHEGVDAAGRHLFPAFPFDHFTKMTDADVDAIYAYIMTSVAPVEEETKAPGLPFPLNQRILQAGWKLLFVDFGRYVPDETRSEDWNRGAYLAQGVAHCGACHTPRNPVGAEIKSEAYAGATIDSWTAPALTAANPSGVPWTAADFTAYLKTGAGVYHGVAAGPMGPVVHAGLRALPDADLAAIGVYLGGETGAETGAPETAPALTASIAAGQPDPAYRLDQGARLYASACASCHYNASPASVSAARPDLGINSATRLDDPSNLIHVILDGVAANEGAGGTVMPAFRGALSDDEIAAIAAYLRADRAGLAPWPELAAKVAALRATVTTH